MSNLNFFNIQDSVIYVIHRVEKVREVRENVQSATCKV